MKKTIFALLLALTLAASNYAQGNNWQTFSSEKGKFSILVPAKPSEQVTTANSNAVGPYTTYLFTAKGQNAFYMAGWVDYKPGIRLNIEGELNANRDNFLKGVDAVLSSEKKIALDKNSGIEFEAEKKPNVFIKSRIYIVGSRPYQLIAISIGQEDSINADKFLDSFKLTTQN